MSDKRQATWDRAVDTLASMCVADKMGNGPTKAAFVLTLQVYANEMATLIAPAEVGPTFAAAKHYTLSFAAQQRGLTVEDLMLRYGCAREQIAVESAPSSMAKFTPHTYLVAGKGVEGDHFYVRCLNVSGENPDRLFSSNPAAGNYRPGCELLEVGDNLEIQAGERD